MLQLTSVPSYTAFATSEHSARVGLGFVIIDSNICVAVMTGFPAILAFRIMNFCAKNTLDGGISIPSCCEMEWMNDKPFRVGCYYVESSSENHISWYQNDVIIKYNLVKE